MSDDLENMSVNQRRALDKSLSALEAMADIWAAEINLNAITQALINAKFNQVESIANMIKQGFIEGAYRHYLDHKDAVDAHLSAQASSLVRAAQAVIDRWNSPAWKDVPHTAEYIASLQKALDGLSAQSPADDDVKGIVVGDSILDQNGHTVIMYNEDGSIKSHTVNGVPALPMIGIATCLEWCAGVTNERMKSDLAQGVNAADQLQAMQEYQALYKRQAANDKQAVLWQYLPPHANAKWLECSKGTYDRIKADGKVKVRELGVI